MPKPLGQPKKSQHKKDLENLDKYVEKKQKRYGADVESDIAGMPPVNERYDAEKEKEELEGLYTDSRTKEARDIMRASESSLTLRKESPEGSIVSLMNQDMIPSYDYTLALSHRIGKASIEKCATRMETLELRLKKMDAWIDKELEAGQSAMEKKQVQELMDWANITRKEIRAELRTLLIFKENLDKLNAYLSERKDVNLNAKYTLVELKNATEAELAYMGGMDILEVREIFGERSIGDVTREELSAKFLGAANKLEIENAKFEDIS